MRTFTPFRLFDIFRTPSGEAAGGLLVEISDTGLATFTCQPRPAPSLTVSETGMVSVACLFDPSTTYTVEFRTADGVLYATVDGLYYGTAA